MGLYLKKFENHTQYENYINGSSAILPNVSICTTEGDVHYNPLTPTPPTPSHDYVEIGGVKWATMNVGASSITDGGLYFAWAETTGYTADQVTGSSLPHKDFQESDNVYYSDGSYTKYNSGDGLVTLEPGDDAVTDAWGGNWRMPTVSEWQALGEAVNSAWTADYQGSGIAGLILTDKTDSSKVLFFPAAGYCYGGRVYYVGSIGRIWSSSLYADFGENYANYMSFDSDYVYWDNDNDRYVGYSVRGVLDE